MRQYDISVILPFQDHEEIIGTAVARIARFVREQALSFEIIAVDDDSGDNSQAVLALIRASYPELRVVDAPGRGRGYQWGARQARGQVMWFIQPDQAMESLAHFNPARERICRGEKDLIVVEQRFMVIHRVRCWQAVQSARGPGEQFQRRLIRRARRRGLQLETPARPRPAAPRWASPLVAALSLHRPS